MKRQTRTRHLDSVAKEHAPREERSAVEFYSGKVPLRPIHRIGFLVVDGVPLLVIIFFILPMGISSLKGAPILVWCLFAPFILLWIGIALATGRYVWAALTAPSQRDEDSDLAFSTSANSAAKRRSSRGGRAPH